MMNFHVGNKHDSREQCETSTRHAVTLDAFAGISGNMLLGAFLAAGVPEAHLRKMLSLLPVEDEYVLCVENVKKLGISATYVDVKLTGRQVINAKHHFNEEDHGKHHHHRTMASIAKMINDSPLSDFVKKTSLEIFDVLALAEGKVHGMKKEEVAFHEVGCTDSIVDIVGIAICLEYLGIEKIFVSKINTGTGFVRAAHGVMPVPAPATAELLQKFPVYHNNVEKELTTPTGAAFVAALAEYRETLPENFSVSSISYGAGTYDLEIPNVLRMYLGEIDDKAQRDLCVLEANIDNMSPEIYGYLMDRLFAAGALDVWMQSIYMKKNRPAVMLSVLVEDDIRDKAEEIIFEETTTIGLREIAVARRPECARKTAEASTKYGKIPCKISALKGRIVSISPEYEVCRRLAEEKGVPLKDIRQEALSALRERLV